MSNDYTITGLHTTYDPCVLDEEALEHLDRVAMEILEVIDEENRIKLEEARIETSATWPESTLDDIDRRIHRIHGDKFTSKKVLSVKINDHKSVKVSSFEDARSHTDILSVTPISFDYKIEGAVTTASVEVTPSWLQISVYPRDSIEADRVFGKLVAWAKSKEPGLKIKTWRSLSDGAVPLFFLSLFIVVLLSWEIQTVAPEKDSLIAAAGVLLTNGLAQEEAMEALEIMLKLETGNYDQGSQKFVVKPAFYVFMVFLAIVSFLISLKPKNIIGLGKGRASVNKFKYVKNILFISVPTLMLSVFVYPWLTKLLGMG